MEKDKEELLKKDASKMSWTELYHHSTNLKMKILLLERELILKDVEEIQKEADKNLKFSTFALGFSILTFIIIVLSLVI